MEKSNQAKGMQAQRRQPRRCEEKEKAKGKEKKEEICCESEGDVEERLDRRYEGGEVDFLGEGWRLAWEWDWFFGWGRCRLGTAWLYLGMSRGRFV